MVAISWQGSGTGRSPEERKEASNHEATDQSASHIGTMSAQADPQTLNAEELAVLEPLGTRRKVEAGEYLYTRATPLMTSTSCFPVWWRSPSKTTAGTGS